MTFLGGVAAAPWRGAVLAVVGVSSMEDGMEVDDRAR